MYLDADRPCFPLPFSICCRVCHWIYIYRQLTLLTLAVVPLIAIAGGAYTIIMSTPSEKGEAAYAEAGNVAEEVITKLQIHLLLRFFIAPI